MELKVTGVIPVYNHEHAVPAVAGNLRAQGLPVVLVDDVEKFRYTVDPDALARLFYDSLSQKILGL